MKKIVFVGANTLIVPHIEAVACVAAVTVCEEGEVVFSDRVTLLKLKKSFFGLNFNREVSLPFYQINLRENLEIIKPDTIVVMDFIRLWYWQVIWYRLWHSDVNVVLYVETQRVPKGILSKIGFYIFLLFYRLTENFLSAYFVYTDLGKKFSQDYGVKVPVAVLPVPVDVDLFVPSVNKKFIDSGKLRLLMNARFVSYKRHIDLLKAILEVKKQGIDVSLTCIGRGGDQARVRQEVDRLGLGGVVSFAETLSKEKLVLLYQSHDVLVLPSDGEAIGMVVPEAMACGLPTITTDTVGANVYVVEGKTGLITKTNNPQALAQAIVKIAEVSVLEKMGKEARLRVMDFSINKIESLSKKLFVTFDW